MTNEDAIKILEEMPIASNVHFEAIAEAIEIAIKALRNERPQGEWKKDEEHSITIDIFKFSVCGGGGHTHFRFCPKCGADMRGGQENDPN